MKFLPGGEMTKRWIVASAISLMLVSAPAYAQRADENAARAAGDAFGTNIGNEKVGIYTNTDVRGFNPTTAGNLRLEGLYFDLRLPPPPRTYSGSQVRVGLTAQAYPFPAPTGIIDFTLKPVGDRPFASTYAQIGPNRAYSLEYDSTILVTPGKFGVSVALNVTHNEDQPKDTSSNFGFSVSPRWRPTESIEIRPFVGFINKYRDKANPLIFVTGPRLPKLVKSVNYTPSWTTTPNNGDVIGVLGQARLSPHWRLHAGVMRFDLRDAGPITESYLNVGPDGLAPIHRFANQLPFYSHSYSGEGRLTGVFTGQDIEQVVQLSVRARDGTRNYGGAAQVSFANEQIDQFHDHPEPPWVYGPEFREDIRQWTGSASYLVARRGWGNIGLGVQKIDYRRTITPTGGRPSATLDKPLLFNGSVSLTPIKRLALYGAFTNGLEEAPAAPEIAANAQEAPPAIRTKQVEFGGRYIITPRLRLVVGYFDIQKPYFNLDAVRIWRQLGVERHRGLEASLSGEVFPGLNVVGGLIHMNPVVTGEAVRLGLIGPVPVGQPRNTVRLNFDYRATPTSPLSVDGAFSFLGGRFATSRTFAELGGRQLGANGIASVDAGVRYRLPIAGHHSTLRAQVLNVFDKQHWLIPTTGGLSALAPRRYVLSLATDF